MAIIVHIDMNCFFASCEVKKDPSLKGKKIIIGGTSNRSIVSACSYEAKKDGVYTPMPIYQAKEICHDAIFLPVDYEYYEKVHNEIFDYLRSLYPILEIASIDEAFIDMSDIKIDNPIEYFTNIQKTIYEKMHIPCSIGVSYNKFLAKMASDIKKPLGITFIHKKDIPNIIWPLKIGDFFGIGKSSVARLNEIGVYKIGDLLKTDEVKLREILMNSYDYVINNVNGNYSERIVLTTNVPKSIGNSHTLNENTKDYQTIKENLKWLSDEVSLRLKANKMLAYTITLTLKDPEMNHKTKSKQIIEPTDDNDKIFIEILKLLDQTNYDIVRLVGVSCSNLIFANQYYEQLTIFSKIKDNDALSLINKFNQLVGKNIFIKAKDAIKNDR